MNFKNIEDVIDFEWSELKSGKVNLPDSISLDSGRISVKRCELENLLRTDISTKDIAEKIGVAVGTLRNIIIDLALVDLDRERASRMYKKLKGIGYE